MRAVVSCLTALTLAVVLGIAGCASAEAQTGTIEVRVTDTPPQFEVSNIMVTVSKVQISRSAADEAGGVAWLSLSLSQTNTFDLLQIAGQEQVLASAEVGAGSYSQIRVIIDKLDVTLSDESEMVIPPIIPEKPFDFIQPFEVTGDETTVILFDFDVDKSVVTTAEGDISIKPIAGITVKIWQEGAE